jgi:hypothetical protein
MSSARYGEPTDEHMRELILRELSRQRLTMVDSADSLERRATDAYWSDDKRAGFAARAVSHRRQAAHYQQAIDLLTAAPMPPEV